MSTTQTPTLQEGLMTTFDGVQVDDDLPINVDDRTRVLVNGSNDIVIRQGHAGERQQGVTVTDVEALTLALTQAQLIQAERQAMDDRPMTDDHRKAIFAALRDVHGNVSRQRRLAIVSAIVQREVESLSNKGSSPWYVPLTRAEATHVLNVLNA